MKLDNDDHAAIAQQLFALLKSTQSATTAEILTRAEAMVYVKRPSQGGFCEWCKANGVRPHRRGRYSRTMLDVALQREARKRAA